ncbi:3-(4-hydroxyphenyl)acrylonitrile synthase [Nocardia amikacinitolerans]|uniref:TauD/TfdA dioxygenase family protein n=1 Tax=Nocardia amikacinitolerans TaxID=756689 RepID=UPI00082EB83D|nr:TauD/TfdA family dioxygenase [Nocardia amikacinitolerans]MCP2314744.1 3-(4-hydroxyphenyl)acrylonitrile synthase [Nocardia amikacinitolerans]
MTHSLRHPRLDGTDLHPFGKAVTAETSGMSLRDIAIDELLATTLTAKVLVLRGFGLLSVQDLESYCRVAGEILQWDFGSVLNLDIRDDPQNYLFDSGDVPFHWDGAFAAHVPRFFLFQCVKGSPSGAGGETVFCDSVRVVHEAPEELRALWAQAIVTYRTDKLAHYGGLLTAPLLGTHPTTGETTIRYAEPLDPARYLNPLFLTVDGLSPEDATHVMDDLRVRLRDPKYCYAHHWETGDIVVVENHGLLHGRNAFTGSTERHLQRIQII